MKMEIFAFIKIDNVIDIITNSSSELFVIEKKLEKEVLLKLVQETIGSSLYINDIDERIVKDKDDYELDVDYVLDNFPEKDREELKQKYFTEPNWYSIGFSRDWIYEQREKGNDVREKLIELGFEIVDSY